MKKLFLISTFIISSAILLGENLDFTKDSIKLTKPDLTSGKNIMESLNNRKSSREFSETPLTLEEVSEILWACNGVNREDGKRTAPSGLNVQPMEIYAVFKEGICKYNPVAETLTLVVKGDHRNLSGMQDFVYAAPLNLVYIADLSKYDKFSNLSKEDGITLALQDAASQAQNVNLYTAGKGMKSITRGGAKWEELFKLLNLDNSKYKFVLAQTVGK